MVAIERTIENLHLIRILSLNIMTLIQRVAILLEKDLTIFDYRKKKKYLILIILLTNKLMVVLLKGHFEQKKPAISTVIYIDQRLK